MKTVSPFIYRTAKALSVLGHPLLTISLFVLYITFQQLPTRNAIIISALLLGGVVIPISWYNYQKVKQSQYTNFDVSDQRQRAQFYPVLIGAISLMTGILFITHQPRPFCYGTACTLLLVVSSYGVNRYIKASLHTSLSFFLTWAVYSINQPLGLMMGVFAILIGASRLVLGRHTLLEILVGALIGLVSGTALYGAAVLT
ncbi:phosphatase PAP2 family protein [Spirosoma utsteinense]|uniref:Membrane-associated phospholipid phosphatase n=1 Tax=Spirosoma utsteinense TaxID=2585773 RepID=A0ABR6WC58_9BACT|nr:phosphatase PAP2 family protein [Spirosoma utsteinense]MBC3788723.1 membrane-associated phospholipid phosphatase [Spirosoma utsteinense]MBC3794159.1 membrane-associated phospholipid phosphatase [Spirosoma utsteinense]